MALPEIPECDVSQNDDGTYLLRHKGTRAIATATTEEDAELQGAILRGVAALVRPFPYRPGATP